MHAYLRDVIQNALIVPLMKLKRNVLPWGTAQAPTHMDCHFLILLLGLPASLHAHLLC